MRETPSPVFGEPCFGAEPIGLPALVVTASAAAAVAAAYAAFASSESHFVGSPIFVSSAPSSTRPAPSA